MKRSGLRGGKPWRKFGKAGAADRLVRRVCCAALILEAAVWISRSSLGTFRVERMVDRWMSRGAVRLEEGEYPRGEDFPAGAETAGTEREERFGIRLRIEDGVVEFYRQEEIRQPAGEREEPYAVQ